MPGPLDGVRIMSLGTQLAGNCCAMWLAELGAEVIKVESPVRLDGVRWPLNNDRPRTMEPSGVETTALYGGVARSVKSIGLDLKQPRGREVFGALVAHSDAVLENFSRSAAIGLGLSFERLVEDRRDIVLLSISGFGRTGPYAEYVAFGGNVSSYHGMTHLRGYAHAAQPDYVAAAHGGYALVSALLERDRTGEGCWIDLSQAESVAALLGPYYLATIDEADEPTWSVTAGPDGGFAGVFPARGDDEWVAVEAADDSRREALASLVEGSAPSDLQDAVAAWVAKRTPWQAQVLLQQAAVPSAAVHHGGHLYVDPQLRARGYMTTVDHPDLGSLEYPGVPYRMSATPGGVAGPAARLGEHTHQVLTTIAGLADADVDALVDSGLAWTSAPAAR